MMIDPAHLVEEILGGPTAIAPVVGKDVSSVVRWKLPKSRGGADGRVPLSNIFKIWCVLIKTGSPVTLEQLVFTAAEQEALVALRGIYSPTQPDASSRKISKNCGVEL